MTRTSKKNSPSKLGILGVGSVGRNLLENIYKSPSRNFDLRWVADSRTIFASNNDSPLTRSDLKEILRLKVASGKENSSRIAKRVTSLEITNFETLSDEADLLKEKTKANLEEWIIIDSTHMSPEDSYRFYSRTFMGACALIAANKTAWANRGYCKKLFSMATETKTLLSLNCTLGVWVDQMEYVPIFLSILGRKNGLITKRDNSSLSLFFARVGAGLTAEEALAEAAHGGFLEPGAKTLVPEVRDQIIKLKILANVARATGGFQILQNEKNIEEHTSELVPRADPTKLASWHLSGRKKELYPALVSNLAISGSEETINLDVNFINLEKGNALARDFPGINSMSIRFVNGQSEGRNFIHSGFGGASKTAKKLLWEADRAWRLTQKLIGSRGKDFDPIPVMMGLRVRDPDAVMRKSSLISSIS